MKTYTLPQQSNRPYESLAYAIASQAVEDCQDLQIRGIVKNGKITDPWPRRYGVPKRYLCNWYTKNETTRLLYWMENYLDSYLVSIGDKVKAEEVFRSLEKHQKLVEEYESLPLERQADFLSFDNFRELLMRR